MKVVSSQAARYHDDTMVFNFFLCENKIDHKSYLPNPNGSYQIIRARRQRLQKLVISVIKKQKVYLTPEAMPRARILLRVKLPKIAKKVALSWEKNCVNNFFYFLHWLENQDKTSVYFKFSVVNDCRRSVNRAFITEKTLSISRDKRCISVFNCPDVVWIRNITWFENSFELFQHCKIGVLFENWR